MTAIMLAILLAALWIGPAQSGSWYSPERSGEGFTLQVLDDGRAVALWFTYPPDGAPGSQAWIYADGGRIEGDRVVFDRAFTTRGPRFGAGYDASQRELLPWGTLEFRFIGCQEGEVRYAGPPAWGSGTRPITRLTSLDELGCDGKHKLGEAGTRSLAGLRSRSGSWFDPAHDGEGWTVEELGGGRALVYWFTYDAAGEQAWTVGEASLAGDRYVAEANVRPVGTRFGASFDATRIQRSPWGRLELDFEGCDRATARYASNDPAFGQGVLRPIRLSRPAGAACVEGEPALPSEARWTSTEGMPLHQSEMSVIPRGTQAYVAGGFMEFTAFLRYDAATGQWETLSPLPVGRHHAVGVAIGNEVFVAGGYPFGAYDVQGLRYDIASGEWRAAPGLPPVAASGAAALGGYGWFGDLSGALYQFDPRNGQVRRIPGDGRAWRDHSQVVAFLGELWMIGGRGESSAESTRVSIYDPAAESWRPGPDLRIGRAGFAAAAEGPLLIVAGGEMLANGGRTLSSVEAIAAGASAWSALPPLPTAVHGTGALLAGGAFHVLGGSTRAGGAVNPGLVQVLRWNPP